MKEVGTQSEIGAQIRRLRKAKDWTVAQLAVYAGMSPSAVSQIETGRRSPTAASMAKLARALEVEVRDLFPLGQTPLPDFEEARPGAESVSPKQRRYAAWARRAELERTFQHLTLRLQTLQDQAKTHYEADATHKDLWPVFMDSVLLTRGAEALLAETREEAAELGGETAEERRLRDRLEHRIEDADEAQGTIGDMWHELLDAKNEAENEALRKELRPKTEPADANNVRNLFRREQAV
jgi:transcriptional regulator with XRE-family HTH domain